MPSNDRKVYFKKWTETPLLFAPNWREQAKGDGFTMTIEPHIEQEICSTVSKQGTFYASGDSSVIIVSPETQKVFFVYRKECNLNVPF